MKQKFWIELTYNDGSTDGFSVEMEGPEHTYRALLSMVTRGTLMASIAVRAVAYNSEGFDVVAYQK